jgi:hypothetical protein
MDINTDELDEENAAYWVAQLRKEDLRALLKKVGIQSPVSARKATLLAEALARFKFHVTLNRGDFWSAWNRLSSKNGYVVFAFRHAENDWTRGIPELVDPAVNAGLVNIAARLICAAK